MDKHVKRLGEDVAPASPAVSSSAEPSSKRPRAEPELQLPPGARLLLEYVSKEDEGRFLQEIDKQPWNSELRRRRQQYGVEYAYKARTVEGDADAVVAPLPEWQSALQKKLHTDGIFPKPPEQLLVNEYTPGQGIAAHTDAAIFGSPVVSLSLGSRCTMVLSHPDGRSFDVELPRRSLLVLDREARWVWKHHIPPRKTDKHLPRQRRVSLTYRVLRASQIPAASSGSTTSADSNSRATEASTTSQQLPPPSLEG